MRIVEPAAAIYLAVWREGERCAVAPAAEGVEAAAERGGGGGEITLVLPDRRCNNTTPPQAVCAASS